MFLFFVVCGYLILFVVFFLPFLRLFHDFKCLLGFEFCLYDCVVWYVWFLYWCSFVLVFQAQNTLTSSS